MTRAFGYQILGVAQNTPMDEITKRYQELLKRYTASANVTNDIMYDWLTEAYNNILHNSFEDDPGYRRTSGSGNGTASSAASAAEAAAAMTPEEESKYSGMSWIDRWLAKHTWYDVDDGYNFMRSMVVMSVMAFFLRSFMTDITFGSFILFYAFVLVMDPTWFFIWIVDVGLVTLSFNDLMDGGAQAVSGIIFTCVLAAFIVRKYIWTLLKMLLVTIQSFRDKRGIIVNLSMIAVTVFSIISFAMTVLWFMRLI